MAEGNCNVRAIMTAFNDDATCHVMRSSGARNNERLMRDIEDLKSQVLKPTFGFVEGFASGFYFHLTPHAVPSGHPKAST